MKKGELIALNVAFGKLTLPDMRMEDLYPIGASEISLADAANRDWWDKSMAMRARLLEEEADTKVSPCIPRDLFAQMVKGLSTNEATLLMRHLVKKEGQ